MAIASASSTVSSRGGSSGSGSVVCWSRSSICSPNMSSLPFPPGFRISVELVHEVSVRRVQTNTLQCHSLHRSLQELVTDFGKHRIRQNCIDHAPAALDLCAAADDQLDGIVVVGKWDLVVFFDPLLDAAELQADNAREHRIAQRIVRYDHEAPEQRRRELLEQRLA